MPRPALPSEEASAPSVRVPTDVPERRVFRVASALAMLALIVAVGVNWLVAGGGAEGARRSVLGGAGSPSEASFVPERPMLEQLPDRIVQYETMTRQGIPGQGKRAAEAIYNTLQMNVEAAAATRIYARVEAYPSADEAQSRATELLGPYTLERTESLLGTTKATTAFAADRATLVTVWVRDNNVTLVKTSFRTLIPGQDNTILEMLHGPVVDAVDVFQRTGRQGVSK